MSDAAEQSKRGRRKSADRAPDGGDEAARSEGDRRGGGGNRADEPTDIESLEAWRAGDRSALATLLRGYQARVYAVCYRMLRTPEEASDLTQDALTKIIEGLHTYNGRSQLSTWIIRVSMNCCLSHLRKQRVRRHGSIEDPAARDDRSLLREPTDSDRVEQEERQSAVERALVRLDPEMRAIVMLRDVQGLEYQQIAEVLAVPVGTVKSRLFRARMALREIVAEELPETALDVDESRPDDRVRE